MYMAGSKIVDIRKSNVILDPDSFMPYRLVDIKLKVLVEAINNFRGDVDDINEYNCEQIGKHIGKYLYKTLYGKHQEKKNEVLISED